MFTTSISMTNSVGPSRSYFRLLLDLVSLTGIVGFVLFYSAVAFRQPWLSDFHLHHAVISELYRNIWHPVHEAMSVAGGSSTNVTPYMVVVALLGQALDVSAYRALQLAGVFNMAMYAVALCLFFRTFAPRLNSSWPTFVFLVVSLFLRSEHYGWSSETDYLTMRWVQAYPSMVAWTTAILTFVVAEHVVGGERRRAWASLLALMIGFQFLSHALTASWVIGIVGLRALFVIAASTRGSHLPVHERDVRQVISRRRAGVALLVALGVGMALTLLWPYYSPLLLTEVGGVAENSRFGSRPFQVMPAVYMLGLVAALSTYRDAGCRFLAAGFIASLAAWALFRMIGFQFGDRYVFFMAFFPQALIAIFATRSLQLLVNTSIAAVLPTRFRRMTAVAYLVALALFLINAPILRWEARLALSRSPDVWTAMPSEQAYYIRYQVLPAILGPADIIMMPVSHDTYDVAAATGAKVVAVPFGFSVPDFRERQADVQRFFSKDTDTHDRVVVLRRWKANKVLLSGESLERVTEMTTALGDPIFNDGKWVIFDTARWVASP